MNETEYLADPNAGLDKTGRKVSFEYVPNAFCPTCGAALRYLIREDKKGRRVRYEQHVKDDHPRSDDAVKVDRVVRVSKYESKKRGFEWLHVYKYICHRCGGMTEGHIHKPPKVPPQPLPYDYYVTPPDPEPVQDTLADLF